MPCSRKIDLVGNMYLSDAQSDRIKHLIPQPLSQPKGGPPPHSQRACLEGILFVFLTGCQWEKLPKCFPSSSTCRRRFDEWTRWGIFEGLWYSLLMELEDLQGIDWKKTAADAWFLRAKKGGSGR
ncbi:transposase [Planctomicrobium sp. SH668]|uniref:transposase n=1 Tax=Planctomicrobium sp. SH668 TaxID=3448126 RepID=UPI003F5B00B8